MVEINGGDARRPWREEEAMARLRNAPAWASLWDGRRRGLRSSWKSPSGAGRFWCVRTTTARRRGRKGEARVRPKVKGDLIDVGGIRMAAAWRIRGVDAARAATELPVSSRKEKRHKWAGLCTVDLEPRCIVPVFFCYFPFSLFFCFHISILAIVFY